MMRIQILPLPPVTVGTATRTPFVVCLDRLQHPEDLAQHIISDWIRDTWGATSVLVSGDDEEFTISPQLELPPELAQQLLDHLTATTKERP